ncbi:TIGR03905 family TSCPD domain-containing protein [Christensenellaceae bacterium 44-20]
MYTYYTKGVCSSRMEIELDGDKIKAVRIAGGCNGNLQGIIRLVEGMDAKEAIGRLRGIHCGPKATSCPDQLSIALEQALAERAKA